MCCILFLTMFLCAYTITVLMYSWLFYNYVSVVVFLILQILQNGVEILTQLVLRLQQLESYSLNCIAALNVTSLSLLLSFYVLSGSSFLLLQGITAFLGRDLQLQISSPNSSNPSHFLLRSLPRCPKETSF